jgi:hypothetical protein
VPLIPAGYNQLWAKRSKENFWMGSKAGYKQLSISRNSLWIVSAFLLVALDILFWLYQNPVLGHDQYSYLLEAKRLLSGAQLYGPEIAETNPPLIIWFSVIPVMAAHALRLSEALVLQIMVLAMIVISVGWSLRIAGKWERLRDQRTLLFFAIVLLAIESPKRILLFGQREHFTLICILPYVLSIAFNVVSSLSRKERVALGVFAGLGLCFKPQEILIVVAIEILLLSLRRSLRHLLSIEFLSATFTCALYVMLIALCTPRYMTDMVPLLRETYWALGSYSALYLALHQVPETCAAVLVLFALAFWRREKAERAALLILTACWLASSVAYDLQHTDWSYHRYPARAFIILSVAILLALATRSVLATHDRDSSFALRLASLTVLIAFLALEIRIQRMSPLPDDLGALSALKQGESAYIFSTSLLAPLVYKRNLEWGSRYMHLWMLPSITKNEAAEAGTRQAPPGEPFKALASETVARLASIQRTNLAQDLDRWKPSVVLVERCPCEFMDDPHFNMIDWFSKDAAFAAAWSHYQKQPDSNGFGVYTRVE